MAGGTRSGDYVEVIRQEKWMPRDYYKSVARRNRV